MLDFSPHGRTNEHTHVHIIIDSYRVPGDIPNIINRLWAESDYCLRGGAVELARHYGTHAENLEKAWLPTRRRVLV